MELYGQKSKSIPQKIIIHVLEIFFIWLSYWILFKQGGNYVQDTLHIHNAVTQIERRKIIFVFNIIIFFRLAIMMFYLLKRKIPWEESISVPFAFALYYIGYTLFVLPESKAINWLDYVAIFIFICGCFINTAAEILRGNWKKNPANKGKIYTQGFFKYSMHVNYLGDLLWVSAYAIATKNVYAVSIPVFLFCFFAFYNIPKLDKYLHNKYGKGFENYAKRTKKFIPFIY